MLPWASYHQIKIPQHLWDHPGMTMWKLEYNFYFGDLFFAGKYNQVSLLVQRSTIAHFYRNDLNFKNQLKNGVIIDHERQEMSFSVLLKFLAMRAIERF